MEDSKMKAAMHTVYALALLAIGVVPASADLYTNGPINGTENAYNINYGYAVSDSFVLSSASTVTGVDFGAWTDPGDPVTSVQWSIGTTPGNSSLGGGVANTTDTFVFNNGYDFMIESDSFSTGSVSLGAGTYYLTLQNAATPLGYGASWDLNNGPSSAFQSYNGAGGNVCPQNVYCNLAFGDPGNLTEIPGSNSEAFDIQGTTGTVTPEPGYWALLSVAIVGIAWVKRRRARIQA
jgi:hypothetical protein